MAERTPAVMREKLFTDYLRALVTASRKRIGHEVGDGTVESEWDDKAAEKAVHDCLRCYYQNLSTPS